MPQISNEHRQPRLWALGLFLLALACGGGSGGLGDLGGCGGGGCAGGCADGCADSGCGGEDGCGIGFTEADYPVQGSQIDQAGQIRLSRNGISFLQENAGPLIANIVGEEGLSFCLPAQSDTVEICNSPSVCTDGTEGCQLDIEIDSLSIRPNDNGDGPDSLDITAFINMDEVMQIGFNGFACDDMHVFAEQLPVDASIVFMVDNQDAVTDSDQIPGITDRTWVEVTDFNFGTAGLGIEHITTNAACLTVEGLAAVIVPLLPAVVAPLVDPTLKTILCNTCEAGCGEGAFCPDEEANVCYYAANSEQCEPIWLGMEGEIELGSLLSDFAPGLDTALSFIFYLGNYASAEASGFSLGAFGGAYAPHDDCVPMAPEPSIATVARSTDLIADITPSGGIFHVGVGISKQLLDHAMWAAYQSGALCIAVGSNTIDQITSGTFAIFLPSLAELTEGQNVPMVLRLRPTEPPTVALGRGQVLPGDPPTVVDPLLTLELRNLKIDFYAFMEERFARVFTLDTDIALPLALTAADDGSGILILLGDLEEAFTRIDPANAELLAEEDVSSLAQVLPGLIGSLAPTLAGSLADPIEIPEFGGYRLVIEQDSFTSIEDETMLAIFAKLAPAESDGGTDAVFAPLTTATVVSLETPSLEDIVRFEGLRSRGEPLDTSLLRSELVIDVDTLTNDGLPREYSYRVDGGMWHIYEQTNQLSVRDPQFMFEGEHWVEVRSRVPGRQNTLSLISEPIVFGVDLARPLLEVRRLDEFRLEVEASDSVTPPEELVVRYSVDGGEWVDVPLTGLIALPTDIAGDVELAVEVHDDAGRGRLVTRTFAIHGRTTDSSDGGGCGNCSISFAPDRPFGAMPLALFAIGLLVLKRKRQRVVSRRRVPTKGLFIALVGLAMLVAACSDDPAVTNAGPEGCGDGCEGDLMCFNDACVENACTSDDGCPDGSVCSDDRCVLRTVCTSDDECVEGQFCIDDDDDGGSECLSMPCSENADCSGLSCSGGRLPYCVSESCFCDYPCPDGCGEEEYCCHATNSCEEVPNVCAAMDCETGFGPQVVTDAAGDPSSCEITGPDCECRELPPLPIGDVGSYLSATVATDGTVYVAAFNRTYEDLMVGTVQEDLTVDWTFVDGLAETGEVAGSLNGPRGGIVDGGPRVGRHTGIAADGAGNLHVAYYDESEKELRYARGTPDADGFEWKFETIDDSQGAGAYNNVTLSADGIPAVTYFVQRAEVEAGVVHSQVRTAWADANTPTAWTIENTSSVPHTAPCGGACPGSGRCRSDTNLCQTAARSGFCSPSCADGENCFELDEGYTCAGTVAVGDPWTYLPEGSGLFVDAVRTESGDLAVAWYDHSRGNLMFNQSVDGTFAGTEPQLVDGETEDGDDEGSDPDDTGDVGWYPSVALGPDGAAHFTYVDATNDRLLYVPLGSDNPEVVDTGLNGVEPSLVGDNSNLTVGDDGSLLVTYQNTTKHWTLARRRFVESGWIVPNVVMGGEDPYDGAFGFYLQQVNSGDTIYLLSYRINSRAGLRDVVVRTLD